MKNIFLFVTTVILITNVTQAQDLKISEFQFATSVEEREPVNADTSFTTDIGTVYCFTQITGATDTTQIAHVWYYKDQEKARINLDIKSDDWRTWSSKRIQQSWTGRWRVMIEGPEGNVLATKNFVIRD